MAKYSPTTYAFLIGLRTGGMSFQENSKRMNIPLRTIHDIYRRIVERGFDPEKDPLHFDEAYLETRKASDKDATPKKGKATKKSVKKESDNNNAAAGGNVDDDSDDVLA